MNACCRAIGSMAGEEPSVERILLDRARAGDGEAFRELFEAHAATLERHARRWLPARLNSKVSAADIVQEARIVALGRLASFRRRGDRSFRNWLLRIAENKAHEAVRRHLATACRSARRETPGDPEADPDRLVGHEPSPSEAAIASELRDIAREALARLPAHYRQALSLALEGQLTLKEVAARMHRPYGAVKKIHGRALSRFAREFVRLGGAGDE